MTVVIALAANLLIAIAKTVVAVLTGSASMVAEAAHSWADTGNEGFLRLADHRSERDPDPEHPFGHGREAYVWSMFAAIGLFAVGATVSVLRGIQELLNPEPVSDYTIAYIVLGIALILEGISLARAVWELRGQAERSGWDMLPFAITSSRTTLRAVLAEDSAAIVGVFLAAGGLLLHQVTGSAIPDGIASLLIGVLLAIVAFVLINRNLHFLIGAAPPASLRESVLDHLRASPDVSFVSRVDAEFVGPGDLLVIARVGLHAETDIGSTLRRIEAHLSGHDRVEVAVATVSEESAASVPEVG
jgi:cation diffusion facilitator family transporter